MKSYELRAEVPEWTRDDIRIQNKKIKAVPQRNTSKTNKSTRNTASISTEQVSKKSEQRKFKNTEVDKKLKQTLEKFEYNIREYTRQIERLDAHISQMRSYGVPWFSPSMVKEQKEREKALEKREKMKYGISVAKEMLGEDYYLIMGHN